MLNEDKRKQKPYYDKLSIVLYRFWDVSVFISYKLRYVRPCLNHLTNAGTINSKARLPGVLVVVHCSSLLLLVDEGLEETPPRTTTNPAQHPSFGGADVTTRSKVWKQFMTSYSSANKWLILTADNKYCICNENNTRVGLRGVFARDIVTEPFMFRCILLY